MSINKINDDYYFESSILLEYNYTSYFEILNKTKHVY